MTVVVDTRDDFTLANFRRVCYGAEPVRLSLDSLTGTLLLREVQRRFGVDVAGTDLNLDALATLGTLASFIAAQGGS